MKVYLRLQFDSDRPTNTDGDLVLKIKELALNWKVHFSLVRREANSTADLLAKRGAWDGIDLVERLESWQQLRDVFSRDLVLPT
ncbi:hypothetical protein AHAS_Ahas19G0136200 [Arachis hypogaea]